MFAGKYRIFELFGIPIYLDFSLIILLLMFSTGGGDLLSGLFAAFLLLASITLHELGHALTARAFGYRTHDITRILSREKCACGRTSLRIDRITGRTDDMLIVKGVNFYPRQVEQALKEIPGVADEFQIILEEKNGMTDVTVNVEAEPGVSGHTVAKHLKERLGFLPKGEVFPIGALPRTEGKAKRVIRKKLD